MTSTELKVSRIGNSRGIRIPATTLKRYMIGETLIMEERSDGILLRPKRNLAKKLTWQATADAMADAGEDWSAWDVSTADGLTELEWKPKAPARPVAESSSSYGSGRKPKTRSRQR